MPTIKYDIDWIQIQKKKEEETNEKMERRIKSQSWIDALIWYTYALNGRARA